ncbi:porin [Pseudomethylobacillus aquaticus]|uniref:Porin n=1 Tax=Pseudomethylobacillus aquaticus TaxID=2676064 RepID=A0A3N0V6K8_9PROT|nr:porin [Pseudomethylobacillus aquaticus]ROH88315.1 porin [Pseudomethylobacillus aquaticus]
MYQTQAAGVRIPVMAMLCALASAAQAEDTTGTRLKQLETLVKQMQQQRAEQDKQIELLTNELVAIEHHISQAKLATNEPNRSEERGSSKGNPVFAAFKDGLVFEDGSGNWKLQINGRVQADFRRYDPSEWRDDTFSIRRARFGGTFSFLKDFAVRVEGEYANDNTGARSTTALTYGYLDYTRWQAAKLRAGQFKPFFGLERSYSTNFTDFGELSLAGNNGSIFNSTYDRGVMVHGDPATWLNYNAYYVNGTGQNNDDQNDGKDMGARVNANLARLGQIDDAVLHIGASASKGDLGRTSLAQSTEANGVSFFSVTGLDANADRERWGVETALSYGPVKFQAEYINANFQGERGATSYNNDIKAWYADVNWLVTGESWADAYKSGVFGRVRPKQNFDDKHGWGAFELGLRYSQFDASDFRNMLASATANASKAEAWTLGAKWILNPHARIVLNYVQTRFDAPYALTIAGETDDTEKAVLLRAQYDF